MITDQPPCLTNQDVEAYQNDGFVIVRKLFDPAELEEATHLDQDQLDQMKMDPLLSPRLEMGDRIDGSGKFLVKVDGAKYLHPHLAALCRDSRLIERAHQMLGEQVNLFKDKLIFKPPQAAGFSPHQDMQFGWHRFIRDGVSCMIAFDQVHERNGCLQVVPGKHRAGLLGPLEQNLSDGAWDNAPWRSVLLDSGDVVFFSAFLPHRSADNRSSQSRRVYIPTYAPTSDGDQYDRYYDWWVDWASSEYPPDYAGRENQFPSLISSSNA